MDGDLWASLAFTGGPILLMIAFWLFFTGRLGAGKQGSYLARHLASMERQERLLERIATTLERRNARGD